MLAFGAGNGSVSDQPMALVALEKGAGREQVCSCPAANAAASAADVSNGPCNAKFINCGQ